MEFSLDVMFFLKFQSLKSNFKLDYWKIAIKFSYYFFDKIFLSYAFEIKLSYAFEIKNKSIFVVECGAQVNFREHDNESIARYIRKFIAKN